MKNMYYTPILTDIKNQLIIANIKDDAQQISFLLKLYKDTVRNDQLRRF